MKKAEPDSSDSLVFECDLEEPPEKVWRALTEPELLEAWLKAAEPARTDYEILTAEPHRTLRYRWRDRESGAGAGHSGDREVHSVVTVELAPAEAGGTHLRLTHGEFRIVSAVPATTAARVRPITSARRRRSPMTSFAARSSLRRAA
jgi:uncharacterized protein YndB with AHSA1/START domain